MPVGAVELVDEVDEVVVETEAGVPVVLDDEDEDEDKLGEAPLLE